MEKILLLFRLIRQMGWPAFRFRAWYEFRKRTGLLRRDFPTSLPFQAFGSVAQWRQQPARFFFESREALAEKPFPLDEKALETLAVEADLIAGGHVPFFNAGFRYLGAGAGWHTHPETGYHYPQQQHWTDIRELDPAIGDIKLVWEKARFAYLYPMIRHDLHHRTDRAAWVLSQIEDWIGRNPLNCGPHYVCSQEISLRVLNWTFALHYYKHSPLLTETLFQKIANSIYGQMRHVAANIDFSRRAVRNNHSLTECLGLYATGLLYPFFPESRVWRENGLRWLAHEAAYQFYEDGSYLQFSMNYHRVAVQVCLWALLLARRNQDYFEPVLEQRLRRSLELLLAHQDTHTGHLPNYGANDGALFFRLNGCGYRDYRPQLDALHQYFYQKPLYGHGSWCEDVFWYGLDEPDPMPSGPTSTLPASESRPTAAFPTGGFYVLRDTRAFAFIRCGHHPDRPMQADNLHLDLWADGMNLMRDAGSYQYNTDPATLRYFVGTASHNTLQLGDYDQMQKGGRFIWYHWSQATGAALAETETELAFEGKAHVYRHVHPGIFHVRKVTMLRGGASWQVEDRLELPPGIRARGLPVYQRWHPHPDFSVRGWHVRCQDRAGRPLARQVRQGWHSAFYGVKEPVEDWFFENADGYFHTSIFRT